MKDKEIFEGICHGNEKSLEYLYKKYYRMMTKLVMSNSGSEQEAKDIIYQDALVVLWEKVTSGKLVLTSKISTYLYSICQNLWRKELDRKKRLSHEEKGCENRAQLAL